MVRNALGIFQLTPNLMKHVIREILNEIAVL